MNNTNIIKFMLVFTMLLAISIGTVLGSMFIFFDEKIDISMTIPTGYGMEFEGIEIGMEGIDESLIQKQVEVKLEYWMNEGMQGELDLSHSDWSASISSMDRESFYVIYTSPDKKYLDFKVDQDDRYLIKIINNGKEDLEITGTLEVAKRIDHVVSIIIHFIFAILLFIGYRYEKHTKGISKLLFGVKNE